MHIPTLQSFGDYMHVGRIVELLSGILIDFKVPFNLRQVKSFKTTQHRLELMSLVCPKIQKLLIKHPEHKPEALRVLPGIQSLSILEVPAEKEWFEGLYNYLRTNGIHLLELNIHTAKSKDPLEIDLRRICLYCPRLSSLSCDGSKVEWSNGTDPPVLYNLKSIRLGKIVSAKAISKILTLTPQLSSFNVHSCQELTNEQLEKLNSDASAVNRLRNSNVSLNVR